MADDRSQAGRRSWRGKPEPDRRERPAAPRSRPTNGPTGPSGRRPRAGHRGSRSVRLLAGLVAFAACLGVVVWLIWMINPPRPAGRGPARRRLRHQPRRAAQCPGLPGTQGDRASSPGHPRRWTLFNPARLQLLPNPRGRNVLETADDWEALITALKKGFGEPTLILVLALHGGSDATGAYLMPNRMKRPEDRLDMKDVIASMKELPAEKAKILVVEGRRSSPTGGWACSTTTSRAGSRSSSPRSARCPTSGS